MSKINYKKDDICYGFTSQNIGFIGYIDTKLVRKSIRELILLTMDYLEDGLHFTLDLAVFKILNNNVGEIIGIIPKEEWLKIYNKLKMLK